MCLFIDIVNSTTFTDKQQFEHYITQYNKSYPTPHHKSTAYINYINNRNTIDNINSDVTRTWTAGINQFTDLSPAEFRQQYLMSSTISVPSYQQLLQSQSHKLYPPVYSTVADTLDWRNYSDHTVITPIIDQGAIGSCYAISALETVSAQYALINHMNAVTLSVEQIIDCSANYDMVQKHANCGVHGGV